ncbi:MAG: YdeI/OmpD-associated family protein [Planctomycetes bacterium]|jgi:uncharacterized protein YdeI (YjbR/CyaY-like superfamily)|nr:YdeI/OmpD-associated family protein [Planctomycetota bacterium]MCL4731475.1 YdeI/OmpD-associated family protein [Planctomycetota bacterium]
MPKPANMDEYIANAADFARPVLKKLRGLYHKACPEIEESLKWGMPCFSCRGIVGSMAAFKEYVGIGFWKGALLDDPTGLFKGVGATQMSALKFRTVKDLPADKVLVDMIKQAVALNKAGIKAPAARAKPEVKPPKDLLAALNRNKTAKATFEGFSPSHRREYVQWITEAKQQATREKRLAQAIEWMTEGKPRNWKYMKKK